MAKTFQVRGDEDALITTIANVRADGETVLEFSWTPSITHLVRLISTDANPCRLIKWEWVWEPEPPLAKIWTTQPTTHDFEGFIHLYDGYVAHRSTADISLVVTVDGTEQDPITIAHGSGAYRRTRILFPRMKGKSFQYSLTSGEDFRLYVRDSSCSVKQWGASGEYTNAQPFGDVSRLSGARQ